MKRVQDLLMEGAALCLVIPSRLCLMRESLAAEGKTLKKGDILSLGSVTKMIPPKSGSTIKGRFVGLNPEGPVEIWVTFK